MSATGESRSVYRRSKSQGVKRLSGAMPMVLATAHLQAAIYRVCKRNREPMITMDRTIERDAHSATRQIVASPVRIKFYKSHKSLRPEAHQGDKGKDRSHESLRE